MTDGLVDHDDSERDTGVNRSCGYARDELLCKEFHHQFPR